MVLSFFLLTHVVTFDIFQILLDFIPIFVEIQHVHLFFSIFLLESRGQGVSCVSRTCTLTERCYAPSLGPCSDLGDQMIDTSIFCKPIS